MPKLVTNALSPGRVKHERRPGTYADGDNLYLLVTPTGGRFWVWRGTVQGKRRELGIGPVRLVSLADARKTARDWRNIARAGGDPAAERDKAKRSSVTFEQAARKVHSEQIEGHARNEKHVRQWLSTLDAFVFPLIGSRPVHTITQADILRVLSPIWTERPETARRVRQRLRAVLDWAKAAGHYASENPVTGVEKGLPRQRDKVRHLAAVPHQELPDLMRRIEAIEGMGALALRFAILTAARSGEVRGAAWSEIDLESSTWTIPAERMKVGDAHRVPLSDAALAVLEAVKGLDAELVFPSKRQSKPLSDTTLSRVLRQLNVHATVHGFRSTFRDWCEEQTRFSHEVKERALAHTIRDKVEAAYRRTDLFEKRRQLMDQWARYCRSGAESGTVVELRG